MAEPIECFNRDITQLLSRES